MQRQKIKKNSIFSFLNVIFNFLMNWVKNLNLILTWNQYQIESECWNQVFELSQKIDIKYLSWVRRLISKLNLMINLCTDYEDICSFILNWLHQVKYLSLSWVLNLLRLDSSQNSWLEYLSWVEIFDLSIQVKSEN